VGSFETVHAGQVTGTLVMFDRMIFQGHLSALYKQDGARCFLWSQDVELKDFAPWAKATTAQIAEHVRSLATSTGRPVIYADSPRTDLRKEEGPLHRRARRNHRRHRLSDLGHPALAELRGLQMRRDRSAPDPLPRAEVRGTTTST
jgi:hypothetical protein